MAGNRENVDTPHEEITFRPGKEPMGSRRPFNSQSERTTHLRRTQPEGGPGILSTSSRRTQNPGTRHEKPRMNIGRPLLNQVGEDGAYDPTKYIPIVELENCQLRCRLKEANCRNAELEHEAAATRMTRENNIQNQPDPRERGSRGRPHDSRTRGQETAEGNPRCSGRTT
uniref:Uncharacterized protein n=1 Tax=Cannabis sativa TaxID=3483 RepID=A0A803QCG7_CANSA